MTTIKQVIESDLEFSNKTKKEADILFMKPSLIHRLIKDSKLIQGSRYLNINKKQVSFISCPIVEIAENYTDDYLFLGESMVETALTFYKNERFDKFRYKLWNLPEVAGGTSTEPTGNEASPIFDMEIPEHLVDCYKRWKDNASILAYQESLKTHC